MADKNMLKNWFKTGLIPTQSQFWELFDSYWHKAEKLPIGSIENIESILDEKADAEALENHLTDENAHAALFAKTRIIPYGKVLVFERQGKPNPGTLAPGDYCILRIGDEIINANYLGGELLNPESYDI